MNKVIFLGRLVANPEYKINESGKHIGKFRLAVDNLSATLFINVVYFDKLAELAQRFLQKGSQVLVEGRLDMRQVDDVTYYSVVAKEIEFLNKLKEKENADTKTKQN